MLKQIRLLIYMMSSSSNQNMGLQISWFQRMTLIYRSEWILLVLLRIRSTSETLWYQNEYCRLCTLLHIRLLESSKRQWVWNRLRLICIWIYLGCFKICVGEKPNRSCNQESLDLLKSQKFLRLIWLPVQKGFRKNLNYPCTQSSFWKILNANR